MRVIMLLDIDTSDEDTGQNGTNCTDTGNNVTSRNYENSFTGL